MLRFPVPWWDRRQSPFGNALAKFCATVRDGFGLNDTSLPSGEIEKDYFRRVAVSERQHLRASLILDARKPSANECLIESPRASAGIAFLLASSKQSLA